MWPIVYKYRLLETRDYFLLSTRQATAEGTFAACNAFSITIGFTAIVTAREQGG